MKLKPSKKKTVKKVPARKTRRAPAAPKYRMLKKGEEIAAGDEFRSIFGPYWKPVRESLFGQKWDPINWQPVRREVKQVKKG